VSPRVAATGRGSVIISDLYRLQPRMLQEHAVELNAGLKALEEDIIVDESVFQERYDKKQRIGEGATSSVWLGVHKATGEEMAIKMVKAETLNNNAGLKREIMVLRSLDHPNIIKLKDVIRTKDFLYIVMEL
jgi:calcium-dependent protein kinase